MHITQFELTQFRNFNTAKLYPSEKLSVFVGQNGSGKSSIIESLYYLGFGRSFRTSKHKSLIMHDADRFSLFAKAQTELEADKKVGVSRDRTGNFSCQINGEHGCKLSELVNLFPMQLFTPQSTELILGRPNERRHFIDWGVFHVEHSSHSVYRNFTVIHKHRNALLKSGTKDTNSQLKIWDVQFTELAERIADYRKAFIEALIPHFDVVLSQFLPEINLQIKYNVGWNEESSLQAQLEAKRVQDSQYGFTSVGPHKADLKIMLGKHLASEVLSRGQLRMTVAALLLAQTLTFKKLSGRESIFLLDDLGAELDEGKRELFLDALIESGAQVFVTAIENAQLGFVSNYQNKKMFHVEHGHVTEE